MIKIAILGFGVVGSGTAAVLAGRQAALRAAGADIRLKYVLDIRDLGDSPFAPLRVTDFSVIEADPEVSVVVETIGGVGAAYEFTRRSLLAGKSVVTSNKELVATRGPELMAIARENGCAYLFEASVGGGIPLLHPIRCCLGGNELTMVRGIINGTTNYILTQMYRLGQSYELALAEAQRLGYAERDPAADVDGLDACRKISILASLCFGRWLDPALIPTQGIRGVVREDVLLADACGYELKLIGSACKVSDGRVAALVAPHAVARAHLLASVGGVTNGVEVCGSNVGSVFFAGPGAGSLPTASAVAADVIELARDPGPQDKPCWTREGAAAALGEDEIPGRWLLRVREGITLPGCETSGTADGFAGLLTPVLTRPALLELAGGTELFSALRVIE